MKKDFRIPDFLVIGAGKSGTTSLNNYLEQHPQVFMSPVKEPNFFAYEVFDSEAIAHDDDQLNHYKESVTDLEHYLSLFNGAQQSQVIGETSNTYLYHQQSIGRIKYYNANMKLIAILRNPADRLYSRYLHLAKYGLEPTANFSDSLDINSIWWKRPDLIQEGMYYSHLSEYFSAFSKEQIRIYLYEDFKNNPTAITQDIFTFLDVDTNFTPEMSVAFNRSGIVANRAYNNLFGYNSFLQKSIKALLPDSIYADLKKNYRLQKVVNKIKEANLKRPAIEAEVREKLINEVYREEILSLQYLIDKDLNLWLNSAK